jgi:hypothetical protein
MLMKRYETRTTASRFGWEPAAHVYWVLFTVVQRNRKPRQRLSRQCAVMAEPEAFDYYSVDTPGIGPGA